MYDTAYDSESTTKAVARDPGASNSKQSPPIAPEGSSPPPPEREPGSEATVHKAPAADPSAGFDGAETMAIPQIPSEEGVLDHIQDPNPLPDVGIAPALEDVDPIGIPDLEEHAADRMMDHQSFGVDEAERIPGGLPDSSVEMELGDDLVSDPSRTSIDDPGDFGRFVEEPDRLEEFDRFDDDLLDS